MARRQPRAANKSATHDLNPADPVPNPAAPSDGDTPQPGCTGPTCDDGPSEQEAVDACFKAGCASIAQGVATFQAAGIQPQQSVQIVERLYMHAHNHCCGSGTG